MDQRATTRLPPGRTATPCSRSKARRSASATGTGVGQCQPIRLTMIVTSPTSASQCRLKTSAAKIVTIPTEVMKGQTEGPFTRKTSSGRVSTSEVTTAARHVVGQRARACASRTSFGSPSCRSS